LAASNLPYVVHFEQGASRFKPDDNIKILEVRGTSEKLMPGHLYWIKGTYKLGSKDQAQLAVYNTAKNAADANSHTWKTQWINVNRGKGTFELYLPMSHWGWPHVSFYPVHGGRSFGGTYFGTDDMVLKKWWDEGGVVDRTSAKPADESSNLGKEGEFRAEKQAAASSSDSRQASSPAEENPFDATSKEDLFGPAPEDDLFGLPPQRAHAPTSASSGLQVDNHEFEVATISRDQQPLANSIAADTTLEPVTRTILLAEVKAYEVQLVRAQDAINEAVQQARLADANWDASRGHLHEAEKMLEAISNKSSPEYRYAEQAVEGAKNAREAAGRELNLAELARERAIIDLEQLREDFKERVEKAYQESMQTRSRRSGAREQVPANQEAVPK
jgi:hypothetical protein